MLNPSCKVNMTQEFIAGTIDHTLLKPDAVSHQIAQLFKGLSSTNLFSGCFSCAIGPTGKPLKTNAIIWTIHSLLNTRVNCQSSIRISNCCNASSLFGWSKAFASHNVNTLIAFSYVQFINISGYTSTLPLRNNSSQFSCF